MDADHTRVARLVAVAVILYGLTWVVVAPTTTQARPTSAQQAQEVVRNWLAANAAPLETPLAARIKEVRTYQDASGVGAYYAVCLDPDGFVIVAGDDLIEPIMGFSPRGTYQPSLTSPMGALVTSDHAARSAEAREVEASAAKMGQQLELQGRFSAARRKWGSLSGTGLQTEGLPTIPDLGVRVPPLVQSRWSQDWACDYDWYCYNYYTPNHYYSGCVATAMAQLMRYWEHPTSGVGTASLPISVCGVGQSRALRGGDGLGGPYNWTAMVLDPESDCWTLSENQRQAIGALCHDVGVAARMDYCSDGSGASLFAAADALKSVFGYGNAVKGYNSGGNIGAGLNGMANPGLDAGCPVVLGVVGPPGGHAIVCDGYGYSSSTLYHHLNLGWAGYADAWYNLPTIDIAGVGTFSTVDNCVYNAYVTGNGEIISGRITSSAGAPIGDVAITAVRTGGGAYVATSNSRGVYACAKVPSASSYSLTASKSGYHFTNRAVSTGTSNNWWATSGNVWGIDFVGTTAASDFDADGDVDLADFGVFQSCFNGPNRSPAHTGCESEDLDQDNDVDLADFSGFRSCFNGPNRPPVCAW